MAEALLTLYWWWWWCCLGIVLSLTTAGPAVVVVVAQTFDAANAAQVINKMRSDVLAMAREVERTYSHRCNASTTSACYRANYDACQSSTPRNTCPAGAIYADPQCGDGKTCSSLWDFSTSQILISEQAVAGPNRTPTDPLVLEGICATKPIDEYLERKAKLDAPFWTGYGIPVPGVYYGSQTGFMRYFPCSAWSSCSDYDPRQRPWYAAAMSGPKNVILVLDTSMSMVTNGNKLDLLKEMASNVVNKLSVGDRIALVTFNDKATLLGGRLFTGSDRNKETLLDMINQTSTSGSPNLGIGLSTAFDMLEASAQNGTAVRCHSAILVMSGGGGAVGKQDHLVQLIQNRSKTIGEAVGGKIIMFTYTIGSVTDDLMSKIACSLQYGVWNSLVAANQIPNALNSYYQLFALALGIDENKDFIAWAEPYTYFGTGSLGTTLSVPVYDRSQDTHVFLGVVGIDFPLSALEIALGPEGSTNISVARIVKAATSVCPKLELDECVLEAMRQFSSGPRGQCRKANCTARTNRIVLQAETCSNAKKESVPFNMWANLDLSGVPYLQRLCCRVGESVGSTSCIITKLKTPSNAIIHGSSLRSLPLVLRVAYGFLACGMLMELF